jgi:hypothetical protein
VLPLRWQNRRVPARIDAVLRQALSDGAGSDKSARPGSLAALVAELLGVPDALPSLHSFSEDGRAAMPKQPRSRSLTWAAVLALLGGAGVGYWLYTQEPGPPAPAADLGVAADLAHPPSGDLSQSATPKALVSPSEAPHDLGQADLQPRVWPKRRGPRIPELRTADPAAPAPAAAPAAPAGAAATAKATAGSGTSPSPARPAVTQEVK